MVTIKIFMIETDEAEMALWKLAENLPETLLRMEKEEPEALLDKITRTVEKALAWEQEALKRGTNKDQAREYMLDLLNPSYCPTKPAQITITEEQMNQIQNKLIAIAKGRTVVTSLSQQNPK